MRNRASQEGDMPESGQLNVADKFASPTQVTIVFFSQRRDADAVFTHRFF
jgi:hypothetical protein|tara:strand:- start:1283 stop:1432 length:150 start_codon:yes stop_codon:yes gene_type:complete